METAQMIMSCEPCPMCLGAIYWARLDKMYYANTKTHAKDIGFELAANGVNVICCEDDLFHNRITYYI